jgi:hypothetical protein
MNSYRKTAIFVGVLFIAELALYMIGSTLTEMALGAPDYLIKLAAERSQIMAGLLLEAMTAACLVFIGVLMYPVLKRHNSTTALGYFGIRTVETILTAGYLFIHLAFFALGREYSNAGAPDEAFFQTLGAVLKSELGFAYQIHIIFYGLGCSMLFGVLFKAKFVPRFISVGGLITTALMLMGVVFELFGSSVSAGIYASPLALCQIFLGIWLIARGFNPSAMSAQTDSKK